MITENQALEIAKEAGFFDLIAYANKTELTRALNLAAAMALEELAKGQATLNFVNIIANEYRQAAKVEMK